MSFPKSFNYLTKSKVSTSVSVIELKH